MLSNNSNSRKSERRHSSAACLACRKRKIKCDNDRPRCSNCQLYAIDCVFGEDRRRTTSTVKTIDTLRSRVDGLEGLLAGQQRSVVPQHSAGPSTRQLPLAQGNSSGQDPSASAASGSPAFSSSSSGELNSTGKTGHYGAPDMDYWVRIAECPDFIDSVVAEDETTSGEGTSIVASVEGSVEGQPVIQSDGGRLSSNKRPFRQSPPPPSYISTSKEGADTRANVARHQQNGSIAGVETELRISQPTLQLASRHGQLQYAENGQLRYYGATSNLHMIHNGLLSSFEPSVRSVREEGATALHRAGLSGTVDKLYEDHLTNLYFAWHNPFLNEVDRDIYLSEKQLYESGHETLYYSPTLANAVMAVGAAYSTRQHASIDEDTAEYFSLRAKILLDIEVDSPTLATIQALLVLSAHEGAETRDSRGWIYVGMAVQVAIDLGLHISISSDCDDAETGKLAELRKNVFWATLTASRLWSLYTGRPCLTDFIQHSVSERSIFSNQKWEYYIDQENQPGLPLDLNLNLASAVSLHMISLVILMNKISNLLYYDTSGFISDSHPTFLSIARELEQWRVSLPPPLHIDSNQDWRSSNKKSYLPMVLQLHMQYHSAKILLYRPFITSTLPNLTQSPTLQDPPSASQICTKAATSISQLLIIYRRQWGLQYINFQAVHIVMTAGIIHAHDSCIYQGRQGKAARDQLHICLQALGEMGQSFRSGNRGLQVVMSLVHEWQSRSFEARKGLGMGMPGMQGRLSIGSTT